MNNRVLAAAAVFPCTMYSQSPPPGRAAIETPVNALRSPEVNADRTVTLRFRLDLFASIGLFRRALGSVDLARDYDGMLAPANRLLRLLWIGIGGATPCFFREFRKCTRSWRGRGSVTSGSKVMARIHGRYGANIWPTLRQGCFDESGIRGRCAIGVPPDALKRAATDSEKGIHLCL